MKILKNDHPAARRAIASTNEQLGYDIGAVLTPGSWQVARLDNGEVHVLINSEGLRALARFAPRADSAELAERLIQQVRDHLGKG